MHSIEYYIWFLYKHTDRFSDRNGRKENKSLECFFLRSVCMASQVMMMRLTHTASRVRHRTLSSTSVDDQRRFPRHMAPWRPHTLTRSSCPSADTSHRIPWDSITFSVMNYHRILHCGVSLQLRPTFSVVSTACFFDSPPRRISLKGYLFMRAWPFISVRGSSKPFIVQSLEQQSVSQSMLHHWWYH